MSAENPAAVLEFDGASVGYGGTAVVREAALAVRAGEIVGLVGPNGAGKSTLLRAVTGDADLLGGEILLLGEPTARLDSLERARRVAVVPQTVTAAFSFSAREFVEMGRHAHLPRFARPGQRDAGVVRSAMERTDTLRLAEKPVDELSGGDLQRLALAQALAQEPRVLLLDEPVSHLDLNHRLQILELVRDLADGGMAVLAVFHELDLACRYADRLAVVSAGEMRPADAPEAVITADALRDVFGVRAVVGTDPVTGAVSVVPVMREQDLAVEPRGTVLVVGGSGVAAPLMRRLAHAGWRLTAAALNTGDADETLATVLGAEHPVIAPFAPMDEPAEKAVADLAAGADVIVVCEVPFGHGNLANLRAVVASGRSLVLVGGIGGRDFTGGEAARLWDAAVDSGATLVRRHDDVPAALDAIAPAQPR
jgi:iron complex transport system ATP-binding protein